MFLRNIVLTVVVGFLLLRVFAPGLLAVDRLPDGTEVNFIVPAEAPMATGADGLLVFTGRADAIVGGISNCGTQGPLHPAVAISPGNGGSVFNGNVIVTHVNGTDNPSPLPPGTRLSSIVQLDKCGTTNEFQKYRGLVD